MAGGLGNDRYVVNAAGDIITEAAGAGTDTVQSSVTWTLGATLEHLVLTGSGAINGTGNPAANLITGNDGANVLRGGAENDTLSGGGGSDELWGDAGSDRLTGGLGADAFLFNSTVGSDLVTDFASGTDKMRFSQAPLRIGDGDLLVEGALLRGAPGGFTTAAELVIFTANAAALDAIAAAAQIGSATGAYAIGATRLFVIDNGTSSAVFRFTAADANATVSASELALVATLQGTAATALADYVFVA